MKKLSLLLIVMFGFIILVGCITKSDKIVVKIGMWPDELAREDVEMFKEWKRRFELDYPQYEIRGANYEYNVDTFMFMA